MTSRNKAFTPHAPWPPFLHWKKNTCLLRFIWEKCCLFPLTSSSSLKRKDSMDWWVWTNKQGQQDLMDSLSHSLSLRITCLRSTQHFIAFSATNININKSIPIQLLGHQSLIQNSIEKELKFTCAIKPF